MSTSGPLTQILAAFQTEVAALALSLDGNPVPIEVRKQLNPDDGFPILPVLVLAAQKAGQGEPFLLGNTWRVPYKAVVALVASGREDFSGDLMGELGAYCDWQPLLTARITTPTGLGLPFVMQVEAERDAVVDTRWAEKGLDLGQVSFTVWALEDH